MVPASVGIWECKNGKNHRLNSVNAELVAWRLSLRYRIQYTTLDRIEAGGENGNELESTRGTRCDDKRDIANNPSRCCGPTLHFGTEVLRGPYRQIHLLERTQRPALRFYSSATVLQLPVQHICLGGQWAHDTQLNIRRGVRQISQTLQPILKTSRGLLQFTSGM